MRWVAAQCQVLKPHDCTGMPEPDLLYPWSITQHPNSNKFSAIYSANSCLMGHQGLKPTMGLLSPSVIECFRFPQRGLILTRCRCHSLRLS